MTTEQTPQVATAVPHVFIGLGLVREILGQQGVGKNHTFPGQGRWKFRSADDLYTVLNAALNEAQIIMAPNVLEHSIETFEKTIRVVIRVQFEYTSMVDGSRYVVQGYGEANDYADKATAKALTAAYKYHSFAMFCVPVVGSEADSDFHDVSNIGASYQDTAPAPQQKKLAPQEQQETKRPFNREKTIAYIEKMANVLENGSEFLPNKPLEQLDDDSLIRIGRIMKDTHAQQSETPVVAASRPKIQK